MCGIAGIIQSGSATGQPLREETGLLMLDAIAHRGPDDGGLLVTPNLLLGHRRLSILDLSASGHQPMTDEEQRCWLVFNGEIYNFQELRRELEQAGHRFISQTDTEVILRGYLEWGRDVARRLNGMFAFALFDRRQHSLWLVRDPLGIKPLYYRQQDDRLWFGSEIKAILADPDVPRKPDWPALDRFLTFGYTPAPWSGFDGIRQLLPGEWLVAENGGITQNKWFTLPWPDQPQSISFQEATDQLEETFNAAVQRQMISDVPLGAFLSGGLDSSAIVRSMTQTSQGPHNTFTIGFEESSFDESPFASEVAEKYGARHHSRTMQPDASSLLETVVSHAEEPLADNSAIPLYCVCGFARENVTVALSGDGADELLAGYDTYRATELAKTFRNIPTSLRKLLTVTVNRLPASTGKYNKVSLARRFLAGAGLPFPYDHCSWRRYVSAELRSELYTDAFLRQAAGNPLDDYAKVLEDAPPHLSPLEQMLHMDLRFHLPNDMLVKVDRMSMAHSLEVRVPFLDLEVVKSCLAFPPQWKRQSRDGKRVLKQFLEKDLSTNITRRKKTGFLIPLEKWLGRDWQKILHETLNRQFLEDVGMLRYEIVEQLIRQQTHGKADLAYPLFALLILGIWWRIWITRELPLQCTRPTNIAPVQIVYLPSEGD